MAAPKSNAPLKFPLYLKVTTGLVTLISLTIGILVQLGIINMNNDNYSESEIIKYPSGIQLEVVSMKAYFYDEPDIHSKMKTYLIKKDKVVVQEDNGSFIYTSFQNEKGEITNGYLRKADLTVFK